MGVRRLCSLAVAGACLLAVAAGCRTTPTEPQPGKAGNGGRGETSLYVQAERQLSSPDAGVRRQAAVALLSMNNPRALEAVLKRMHDAEDPAVRVSMIEAAAFTGDHRCFDAVLASVNSMKPSVREAAAKALSRFSSADEIEALVILARAAATTAQQKVLLFHAVQEGLFVQATPVLLAALESESADELDAAWQALKAISGLDLSPEVAPWREWWEARQDWTREDILEERLRELRLRLQVSLARGKDLEAELEELSSLVRSAEAQAPEHLLKALGSKHRRIREYVSSRLTALSAEQRKALSLDKRETYDVLRKTLEDESTYVREHVAQLLLDLSGEHRAALVLQALADEDQRVLLKAIAAVNKEMGEASAKRVAALLKNPHPQVREAAAIALGKIGTKDAQAALLEALADKEENVRWFAVESLRKLGATEAVPRLVGLLENDASPRVREITASALGDLGQPAAVPALRAALRDKNDRVRDRAAAALKALAREDFDRMMVIANALTGGDRGDDAIEVLRKVIADFAKKPDYEARLDAPTQKLADLLMAKGDAAGAAELYAPLLRKKPEDETLRNALVQCCAKAGKPDRVVELMKAWLQNGKKEDLAKLVELGCVLSEKLAEAKQDGAGREMLKVLLDAATAAEAQDLADKVRKLMGEGTEEPPPADKPEDKATEGEDG